MKKFLGIIVFLFFIGQNIPSTFAQENLDDWVNSLLGDEKFGHTSSDSIQVTSISATKVVIESPIVKGELGENILDYAIMFGTSPIADAMENTALLDQFGEKEIHLSDNASGKFTIELDKTTESLDPDETYYALILPKDEFGLPGEISNDICFILDTRVYGQGTECDTSSNTNHSAAGPDMNLANITHALDGNKITLRRTSLEGADEIDLFSRNPSTERFETLATVKMSDESYTFTSTRQGEHNIKFIPMQNNQPSGTETIYTLTVLTTPDENNPTPIDTTTTTGVTRVPVVGPKENVLMVIGVTLLGYLGYRFFLRKKAK